MLDGLAGVVSLRKGFGEKLVTLNLLLTVARLFAEVEEEFAVFNGAVHLALSIVNHTNLLVALGLDDLVLRALSHLKALLEELERQLELLHLQVLVGNQLVHTHEVF